MTAICQIAVVIRRLCLSNSDGSFLLIPCYENWGLQQIGSCIPRYGGPCASRYEASASLDRFQANITPGHRGHQSALNDVRGFLFLFSARPAQHLSCHIYRTPPAFCPSFSFIETIYAKPHHLVTKTLSSLAKPLLRSRGRRSRPRPYLGGPYD